MAQVVERRLPAIYDALDSRNNKVGVRPAGAQVQSGRKLGIRASQHRNVGSCCSWP